MNKIKKQGPGRPKKEKKVELRMYLSPDVFSDLEEHIEWMAMGHSRNDYIEHILRRYFAGLEAELAGVKAGLRVGRINGRTGDFQYVKKELLERSIDLGNKFIDGNGMKRLR